MESSKVAFGNKMSTKLKTFFSTKENIAGGIILIATIVIYHILLFEILIFTKGKGIFGEIGVNIWIVYLIPGVISTIIFYFYSKKLMKSIILGGITSIVWVLWLIIYLAITYEVH